MALRGVFCMSSGLYGILILDAEGEVVSQKRLFEVICEMSKMLAVVGAYLPEAKRNELIAILDEIEDWSWE